ncbi:1642_t:CDS:1, partial [Entrophospora sp. SA101]
SSLTLVSVFNVIGYEIFLQSSIPHNIDPTYLMYTSLLRNKVLYIFYGNILTKLRQRYRYAIDPVDLAMIPA